MTVPAKVCCGTRSTPPTLRRSIHRRCRCPVLKRSAAGRSPPSARSQRLKCPGGGGMKIKVQITVQSEEGEAAVVQEVAHLERGAFRADTLGLSLAEARAILAGL